MSLLIYTYECKIDNKGRVLLPGKLRTELASFISDGFILKRSVYDKCIELWPKTEWDKHLSEINNKLNMFNREHVEFLRKFMAGLKPVDLDSVGRILIPKDLIAFADIQKDIVFNGTGEKYEIWDKDKRETYLSGGEDFEVLAGKVMGDLQNKAIM